MAIQLKSELEFGAHAVRAGYQHRFAVLLGNLHQRAEAADAVEHFRAHGALGKRFDVLDQAVARVHVNAGITVGQSCTISRVWFAIRVVQVEFSLSSG